MTLVIGGAAEGSWRDARGRFTFAPVEYQRLSRERDTQRAEMAEHEAAAVTRERARSLQRTPTTDDGSTPTATASTPAPSVGAGNSSPGLVLLQNPRRPPSFQVGRREGPSLAEVGPCFLLSMEAARERAQQWQTRSRRGTTSIAH